MTSSINDFDAAKAVVEQLKGMEKERQERVLRWVTESLNLVLGAKVFAEAGGTVTASGHGESSSQAVPHNHEPHRVVDIRSFVDSKRPKSDVQFAAVVAYYYRFEASPKNRRETIDAKALKDAARQADRRRPPKPLATLNNAKMLGYLNASERGQFQINNVGENLVAMTLPGSEETRTRTTKKRKVKRPGKKLKKR